MEPPEPPDPTPTIRQIYALAAVLCERTGETWPESRRAASELIERLRLETGHPKPRLDGTLRPRGRHGGSGRAGGPGTEKVATAGPRPVPGGARTPPEGAGGRGTEKFARAIARQLVEELRTPAEVAGAEETR